MERLQRNKINAFKTAENVAFEFYEEYHKTKYERDCICCL